MESHAIPFEITPYVIISTFAAGIALVVAVLAWQRRTVPGGTSLAALMLTIVIWSGGAAFEYASTNVPLMIFWAEFEYFGGVTCPVFFLLFVLEYNHMERWLTPRMIVALFIIPVLTLVLVLTNPWHGLIWPSLDVSLVNPHRIIYGHGPAFWLGAIGYSYLLMLIGTLLLLRSVLQLPSPYRRQLHLVITGALVPWFVNVINILGISPVPDLDLTPLVMVLSGTLFAWGIFRFHLLKVMPMARELLIEKMVDGIVILDLHNYIVDLNPAAQAILGISKELAFSKTLSALTPELDVAVKQAMVSPVGQLDVALARDATERFFDLRVSPLAQPTGKSLGWLIILRDITDRHQIENALRESEAQLRALIDYSPASIIKFSPEGNILLWNAAAEKIYGWTADEVLGKPLPTVPTEKQSEKLTFQNQVNQGTMIAYTQVQRQRKDGSPIHIGLSVAPLRNMVGEVVAQMSISTDISELKHAQAELVRREKTVALLEERARLGRDLHDSVTQLLYSVMLFADASQSAVQAGNLDQTQQYLTRLSETARQALKEMRLRVFELRPSVLEHEGLARALRQRLDLVEQRAGVATELQVELPDTLPAPVEQAIYWIVQEALNNTLKHANATLVTVRVNADENKLCLDIADNGKGFDTVTWREHAGLGIANMQERVRDLGGTLQIDSTPETGTHLCVTIPGYMLASIPADDGSAR